MIADADIRSADPAAVIKQYEPYIQKLANRYIPTLSNTGAVDMDDLIQVGRIAVAEAQRKYNPETGSFINFLYYCIRSAMRSALGFDHQTGEPPEILVYLDEPLTEDTDATRLDMVPDTALNAEEKRIEQDTHDETAEAVRAAVDRLKSDRQREVIRRVWLDGQERETAAADMEINYKALCSLDREARSRLRRDHELKQYAMPFFHVGVNRFRSTWTSATEAAVLWREDHLPGYLSSDDDKRQQTRWTAKQGQSYITNLRRQLAALNATTEATGSQDPEDVQTSICTETGT